MVLFASIFILAKVWPYLRFRFCYLIYGTHSLLSHITERLVYVSALGCGKFGAETSNSASVHTFIERAHTIEILLVPRRYNGLKIHSQLNELINNSYQHFMIRSAECISGPFFLFIATANIQFRPTEKIYFVHFLQTRFQQLTKEIFNLLSCLA